MRFGITHGGGIRMGKMGTDELRQKEIINLCDGTRLGYACDFEIDACDGRICALIVPKCSGFMGLGRNMDIVIPWCRIECIGEDAILVKLPEEEFKSCECEQKHHRGGKRG